MPETATTDTELLPPDATFWKRYSPRHEFPIAGSASTLLHLLAVGGVILAGLAMSVRWYGESSQPPAMNVVMVQQTIGDGRSPGGGGPGTPPGTENVDPAPASAQQPMPVTPSQPLTPLRPPTAKSQIEEPDFVPEPVKKSDGNGYDKMQRDIDAVMAAAKGKQGGPGKGGGQGGGEGTGIGTGIGPGGGTGGRPDAKMRAQILANRWHFDSGGSPRDRLAKFAAMGITLGFTDYTGILYIIKDVKRRPIEVRKDSIDNYKEIVTWTNRDDPQSIIGLARELGMSGPPSQFIMMLPQEREQRMADEEMRYAKQKGYEFSRVTGTLFDFVLVGGVYEPVVKGQAPFDELPISKNRR